MALKHSDKSKQVGSTASKQPFFQPKHSVKQPNDIYEHEDDISQNR
jgi:hypothetical protein